MERAELIQLERVVDHEIKDRFPRGTVQRAVVLQHGDDPAIGPGELLIRVFIPAPAGPDNYAESLAEWEEAHRTRIENGATPQRTLAAASSGQAARVHLRRHGRRDSPDHDA